MSRKTCETETRGFVPEVVVGGGVVDENTNTVEGTVVLAEVVVVDVLQGKMFLSIVPF